VCRTALFVTVQEHFIACCRCREVVKLFRVLLSPCSLAAIYKCIFHSIGRVCTHVRKVKYNFKGSRYNEDREHLVWPVPVMRPWAASRVFSKARNHSSNGSTTKIAYVNLRTIFADGPILLRREKKLNITLNFWHYFFSFNYTSLSINLRGGGGRCWLLPPTMATSIILMSCRIPDFRRPIYLMVHALSIRSNSHAFLELRNEQTVGE
jgi:hypothetical protein